MKQKLFLLGLMMIAAFTSSAQVLVGDMDDDGDITAVDVAQMVSTAIGKTAKRYIDPYQVNNTSIVGTWYKSKTESITFSEDGTTSLGTGYTYKYRPNIGKVSVYNASGVSVADYNVFDISSSVLEMGLCGSSSHSFYTSAVPVQMVTDITLDKSTLSLEVDGTYTLSVTVSPSDADNKSVTWSSSNTEVAFVNSSGKVMGVGAGTATIICTANDGSGVKATCAVTVSASGSDANLLPGKFSVSATKQVQFTKSNLYWDGSAYHFEANQTDYPTSWDASHVSHFYWTNLTDYQSGNASYMPYASSYSYSSLSTGDKFWCGEDNPLTVEGTSGLYALTSSSSGEWYYLINSRQNASSLYKYGVTVGDASNCLVIAPDDFTGTLQSSYTLDEVNSLGLVCLPAAGNRNGSSFYGGGSVGYYWSATPISSDSNCAFYLFFISSDISPDYSYYYSRGYGRSLRLVRGI